MLQAHHSMAERFEPLHSPAFNCHPLDIILQKADVLSGSLESFRQCLAEALLTT